MTTIKYDTHNPPRRPRDIAVPTGARVYLSPRDIGWFEMVHRHGPLSYPYLAKFAELTGTGASAKAANARLTKLFHEGFLTRPWQQFGTMDARYQTIIYDLGDPAVEELQIRGLWRDRAPVTSHQHWVHDYACTCVTASLHLAALEHGHGYIFQDEILNRADTGLEFDVGYQEGGKDILLRPDRVAGITYPNGKARFFLVELDRSNERQRTTKPNVKSIRRNGEQYRKFISEKRYKDALALPGGVMAMNLTISPGRMREMMRVWGEVYGGPCNHALFGYLPEFARYFKPPKVLSHLFTDPWERVGAEPLLVSMP